MEAQILPEDRITPSAIPQNDEHMGSAPVQPADSGHRLTPIRYAAAVRFEQPPAKHYSATESMYSILSLLLMSAVSTAIYLQLGSGAEPMPSWVRLPFLFTIFGSTLGWVFELGLLLAGTPFQQTRNVFTRSIQSFRFLNLAPVTTTIFFFVCAMMIPDSNLRMALLYLSGAACFGLGAALFFGGSKTVPLILLATQLAQIAIVLITAPWVGGWLVGGLLVAQAALQLSALLIGAETPLKSTAFHLISTLSGLMLFAAIITASSVDPAFAQQVSPVIPGGSLLQWGLTIACLGGLVFAMKASPMTYNNFRCALSNSVWSTLYFKLISADRFPEPFNLSEVYDNDPPVQTRLKPYYQAHDKNLPESLSIPAVEIGNIEKSVKAFTKQMKAAIGGFKLITALDQHLPQADIDSPLRDKPRLPRWSDGSAYWPGLFTRKILGATMPNGGIMEKTPQPALAAFKEGQLLAFLTEFGVANPFARPAQGRGRGALVSDFRYLEKYATKADYEAYGGMAYFQVDSQTQRLRLVSVVAPHSDREIAANPADPSFRRAEQLVLASIYYAVISGKHLAEIHMTFNLVEVSMHNAFDAQGQWKHPFRTFMYLHFFSHELAEEITTEHLIQEGAVFNQIFATTHEAMIAHLNDAYSTFEYGVDEDFETRAAAMTMNNGDLLPDSCVKWELAYFEIWQRYSRNLIDIIYPSDEAVAGDRYLQDFHSGLLQVLVQGLPARYQGFQTREGVARFAADTIHHCVVRHQVYGTTGIKAALDPRINTTQVPRDTGTPGVDEWRSLACVALATGEARFTLLNGKSGKDFRYLLDGVDAEYSAPMREVFQRLQSDLLALEQRWTADDDAKTYNYDYFRPLPSELRTGPGY